MTACRMVLVIVLAAPAAAAQPSPTAERDRQIEAQLAAVAPAAVPAFHDGTIAYRASDYPKAAPLFRAVIEAAPSFSPGFRRYGLSLALSGRRDEGISSPIATR